MPLILNPQDVVRATNMRALIDSIETGIREQAQGNVVMPARQNLPTSNGFFRVMPCVMRDGGRMGIKIFNGSVQHGVRYIILIYDEKTGELLCLMDAAYLTGARTGATTGIATRYQSRTDARTVGIIGAGLEARTNFEAVCAVRDIQSAKVYSPTPANRERYANEMSTKLGLTITAVMSAQEAVEIEVGTVQTRGRTVVLHSHEDGASVGVGETYDGLDQLAVGQASLVRLELDGERLRTRDLVAHAAPIVPSP